MRRHSRPHVVVRGRGRCPVTSEKRSGLKDWAQAIAKRSGAGKAKVALARKLSVILHSVWRSGQPFRWTEQASAA